MRAWGRGAMVGDDEADALQPRWVIVPLDFGAVAWQMINDRMVRMGSSVGE